MAGDKKVSSPSDAKPNVDIVFVHGLNGDPHNTWTAENSKVFWPSQILPPILIDEKPRVLVYGYDAHVASFTDGASNDKIHNHAEQLIAALQSDRRIRKATERPIVWVAHSLGGLVVKNALIYSSEIRGIKTEHLRSVFVSTYGILFLGTPHHGSDIAQWGNRLEWICSVMLPKKVVDTQPQLVDALKTNNETLQVIDRQFIQIMSRFHIYFFHEGKPTDLKGTLRVIVDETSASPTVQDVERAVIQADHSHICKFENEHAPGFDLVVEGIQRYAEQAPAIITQRWNAEKKERSTIVQAEAAELYLKATPRTDSSTTLGDSSLGNSLMSLTGSNSKPDLRNTAAATPDSQPSKPSEPYFIVPPGFRPNTFFVGMDKELQDLDRRLFDKRRNDGTACVLVHGQPGSGKSHLARQYVNKNRKKFGGGVFWIVSHLKEESVVRDGSTRGPSRDQAFEAIYQKAVARESPDAGTKLNKAGQSFIASVKAWFESRQEWLIVFDGVTVETDADVTELAKFVPDSRNSSLIYVSRQRNLESKQRLLRPYAIRVPVLKVDDARKLLLNELHIKKPTEDQIHHAAKLVQQVDCLPLAIDAISHRIADTHEPLMRYSMKSFSTNPKLEGTYNQILDDMRRLNHMEAWNLINLLAFFGQHVPVEMIHLGIRDFRHIPIKSGGVVGKSDLNETLGTLMRHALLERNEPDSDTSSSRDSLVEPEPIDMLKMVLLGAPIDIRNSHSVVQKFCRDSLNSREMLPEWLQQATQLLQRSYHNADSKIREKERPARVSDYRYYLVHCRQLYEHAQSYESKNQSLAPIRADLEPLLETIEDQIRLLEPGSSQESVNKICQVSIFDRTTSSSDSVPSVLSGNEARTPSHRPSPLPLAYETLWGTDARKPSLESPASIGRARTPRILGHSPYQGFYDDFGYESDREVPRHTSEPMRKNLSEATEMAPANESESREDGWQVVPSNRRQKNPRIGRDLGSFRPTPARATRAEVDRRSVTGFVARSSDRSMNRRSEATTALSEVHSRSPSRRSLAENVTSLWQRRPLASTTDSQRSWANVAAGQDRHPRVQPIPPAPAPAIVPASASPNHASGRHGDPFSSPLASVMHQGARESLANSTEVTMRSGHKVSPAPYPVPSLEYSPSPSQPRYLNNENYYNPPPVVGPNPSRMPYDSTNDNMDDRLSISSKRRLPDEFRSDVQPTLYPTSSPSHPRSQSQHTSPYPPYEAYYPVPSIPAGYSSQPMSRDNSHQSHISAAETEPVQFRPPFTPPVGGNFAIEPSSPRDRGLDGGPLRNSPRSDQALPVASNRTSPRDLSQSYPGPGGWSHQRDDSHPMSRSSSGPGVAIEDNHGYGLGIVPFDGQLRFGDHNPISVDEARQRTYQWESKLAREQLSSRSQDRGKGVPYPDGAALRAYPELDLIPTRSNPDV
ncbi:MAG: hypothetical protein Q9196_004878 [Gyalolechia fulgens]